MQPASTNESQNVSHQQPTPDTQPTSQHGQPRDHDLQDSPQPHHVELRGESEPPAGGNECDATRSEAGDQVNHVEVNGLKGSASPSLPPRDRITEYENALTSSPRKPTAGPLFEVIKSNKKPTDTPIAKLPNGELHLKSRWSTDAKSWSMY
jgi:hypothetical protein